MRIAIPGPQDFGDKLGKIFLEIMKNLGLFPQHDNFILRYDETVDLETVTAV